MAKFPFYAVRVGRYGIKIYDNWERAHNATHRFPGNRLKGFPTLEEARDWLGVDDLDVGKSMYGRVVC